VPPFPSASPSESPLAHPGRGLSLVPPTEERRVCDTPTREDARYWHQRPADHGADGLYQEGPHEARPSLSLVPASDVAPWETPTPKVARARMHAARRRAQKSLDARPVTGLAGLVAALKAA
jgi:hypothetical protein